MITITATEVQNNFGKYLQAVQNGDEIVILKNGKEVARLISHEKSVSFLTDSLVGVLNGDYSEKVMKAERMKKYETTDRH
ncbi:MAG: type II toxin-antitoxin system prevent-host-death family antitoxin [Clostridia bacterium]|nr:type II toxin-antitoxin system prevent-host-death family antitoxin [Clostridia bacterium]